MVLAVALGVGAAEVRTEFSAAGYWQSKVESPRKVQSLNLGWEYSTDDFKTMKSVVLLHSIDEGEIGFEASGGVNRRQAVRYRRKFEWRPSTERAVRQFVHFEAIMGKSRVSLNGKLVAEQFGGFLPIHAEVTGVLKPGENLLEVWCDNSDDASYPPGKPQNILDFTYFGGIYRDAYLVETDDVYVSDSERGGVYVRSRLEADGSWTVKASTTLGGETQGAEISYLFDGQPVAMPFKPTAPSLWTPETPNLHRLSVVVKKAGRVCDAVDVRFGIRDFTMGEKGLVLNGKVYGKKVIGVNRHQDFAFIGMAMSNSLHWRDAKKFREAGFSCIRVAHYPQDPSFMDACDELGLFVIDATPGWQFWNRKDPRFGERVYSDILRMVRRDRSRASLLMWEPILNETRYPGDFARRAREIVQGETEAPNYCACDIVSDGSGFYDVLYGNGVAWKQEPPPTRPRFTREWGDSVDNWNCQSSVSRVARDWGEDAMLVQARHYLHATYQQSLDGLRKEPSNFIGGCLWHGTDHARGYHPANFLGGIMDTIRRKKYSYYAFKAALTEEPFVFAANALMAYSPQQVTIYANRPYTAERFGKPLETITDANRGIFRQGVDHDLKVKLEDGSVYRFSYPWRYAGMLLWLDTEGLAPQADGSDLVVVTAAACDREGHIRRYEAETVKFEVEGPAEIVGTNPQRLAFGEASVLLRLQARAKPEQITVRARPMRQGPHVPTGGELKFTPGSTATTAKIGSGKVVDLKSVEEQQKFFGERLK